MSVFSIVLASKVFSQPAYTADNIFVELLEVRREQPMSDKIGSSMRFTLVNPMPTEQEFEFEREELLEGIAQPSSGFDILVKNTTLKEIIVQNKTYVENTITHTQIFPNGTITWSETQLVQVDGNPSTYTQFGDSGWINITQLEDGKVKSKLKLKPNEKIEVLYITYFKRQLGLNRRDVVPAVKVSNQIYKKSDWAVTFENYNKVIGINTSVSVPNTTIWIELARVQGFDASVDIRNTCEDIRLTNHANDTALKFGIGTLELSGCNTTSGNTTQINFRATSDMNTNPVHLWFNDSAVTTFGNLTWYITNETYDAGNRGGLTTTGATFADKVVKLTAGYSNSVRNIPAVTAAKNGTIGAYGKIILRTLGDRCRVDIFHNGAGSAGAQRLFGTGADNAFFAVDDYNQGATVFPEPASVTTGVQYMMKIELKEKLYGKAWLNSIDEHVGWNQSFSNTTAASGTTYFGQDNTGGNCEFDDYYAYNASDSSVGEPRIYNLTSFTVTTTPVFTVSGGGGDPPASYLSESSGRDATEVGIRNALGTSVPIYTDQQIYVRLTNTSQYLGRFDKVTRLGSQIWAFNYITDSQTPTNVPSVGNALNVLEMVNRTTSANVTTDVQNFITNTRMS